MIIKVTVEACNSVANVHLALDGVHYSSIDTIPIGYARSYHIEEGQSLRVGPFVSNIHEVMQFEPTTTDNPNEMDLT